MTQSMLDHLDAEAETPRADAAQGARDRILQLTPQINDVRREVADAMAREELTPMQQERLSEVFEYLRQANLALEQAHEGINAAME